MSCTVLCIDGHLQGVLTTTGVMYFRSFNRALGYVKPMVQDKRVKWGENIDVSKLDATERKRYHAAIRQRNRRQNILNTPDEKEM